MTVQKAKRENSWSAIAAKPQPALTLTVLLYIFPDTIVLGTTTSYMLSSRRRIRTVHIGQLIWWLISYILGIIYWQDQTAVFCLYSIYILGYYAKWMKVGQIKSLVRHRDQQRVTNDLISAIANTNTVVWLRERGYDTIQLYQYCHIIIPWFTPHLGPIAD